MNRIRGSLFTLLGVILSIQVAGAEPDLTAGEDWILKQYHRNRDQFTLDIPDAWYAVDQTPYSDTGIVAFYSQPLVMGMEKDPAIVKQQQERILATLEDMMRGAAPTFFMERYKATKGMSCAGFDDKAQKKKLKIITNAAAFGKGAKVVGRPEVSSTRFAGCQGLRVLVRASVPNDADRQMLVYTATADNMTYDFALLTDVSYFDQNLPWFERIMTTVRLTGAR